MNHVSFDINLKNLESNKIQTKKIKLNQINNNKENYKKEENEEENENEEFEEKRNYNRNENENYFIGKEDGEEEYEEGDMNENGEEEEGQDVYAFDIQINEASYILLIGKTENSKLIIRLVDKDDENKPFYQNEFSLEELKEINNYFVNFLINWTLSSLFISFLVDFISESMSYVKFCRPKSRVSSFSF